MTTIRGIYENGQIKLLENPPVDTPHKVLITFVEDENIAGEEIIRNLSLTQPNDFSKEYLEDEREDLYQDYAKKKNK